MKRNLHSIRDAVVAVGVLCGAIMVPTMSHAAGAVTVNNSTVCASSAQMNLTPAGDINISCGVVTGPPACTVSITPSTAIIQGGAATVTASCSPTPTTYSWTVTGGGPALGNVGFQTLSFANVGTFTYSVTGDNGAASAPVSITVSAPAPAGTPVCTVSASPSSIVAGGTSTITASCSNSAYGWWWITTGPTNPGNVPSAVVTFPTAGTYTYSVIANNPTGNGLQSADVTVTVGAAGTCPAKAVAGAYSGNSTKFIGIDRGATVSYSLPVYTASARTIELLSIQSTASQSDLSAEFSISECAGDFDNAPAACRTWGTVNTSGTQLDAVTWPTQYPGACTMITGKQYFVNVRNTKFDKVTPACSVQTCYMNVQLNSY